MNNFKSKFLPSLTFTLIYFYFYLNIFLYAILKVGSISSTIPKQIRLSFNLHRHDSRIGKGVVYQTLLLAMDIIITN